MSIPRDWSQRAQTAQDFAVGISIFLLAVAFVFAFVPQALPQDADNEQPGQDSLADRAAATFIANTSAPEEANTLVGTEVSGFLRDFRTNDRLTGRLGLTETVQVNITFEHLNGSRVSEINDESATIGDVYSSEPTVSIASRIVQFDQTKEGVCVEQPCRLVVRVW